MFSGKKEQSERKASLKSSNNDRCVSGSVVSFSASQKVKKIEDAKRRVYAAAEKLSW